MMRQVMCPRDRLHCESIFNLSLLLGSPLLDNSVCDCGVCGICVGYEYVDKCTCCVCSPACNCPLCLIGWLFCYCFFHWFVTLFLDGVRIRVRKIIPIKPFVDIGKEITYSLLVYGRHSDAFIILVAITNTLSSSSFELLPLPYVL